MPELLTRHPELAISILKSAGVKCGTNAPAQILVTCPKDRFCALPTGELCIYGLREVPRMTQISELDMFLHPAFAIPLTALALIIFLIGFITGRKIFKRKP